MFNNKTAQNQEIPGVVWYQNHKCESSLNLKNLRHAIHNTIEGQQNG